MVSDGVQYGHVLEEAVSDSSARCIATLAARRVVLTGRLGLAVDFLDLGPALGSSVAGAVEAQPASVAAASPMAAAPAEVSRSRRVSSGLFMVGPPF
jgi:hypothetical protein